MVTTYLKRLVGCFLGHAERFTFTLDCKTGAYSWSVKLKDNSGQDEHRRNLEGIPLVKGNGNLGKVKDRKNEIIVLIR